MSTLKYMAQAHLKKTSFLITENLLNFQQIVFFVIFISKKCILANFAYMANFNKVLAYKSPKHFI